MTAEATRAPSLTSAWPVELDGRGGNRRTRQIWLATIVRPGDLLTLSGELGAGKTTFARALIRALTQEPDLEVPSPTYTLIQVYESTIPGAPALSDRSCRSLPDPRGLRTRRTRLGRGRRGRLGARGMAGAGGGLI